MDPRQQHPGQSQRIAHNPAVEGRVLAETAARAVHRLSGEEVKASGGPWDNLDREDSILSDTVDTRRDERVYGDTWDRVCKIRAYNPGIPPSAPLGGRTSTRRQQNNIRIWRTTNIRACV